MSNEMAAAIIGAIIGGIISAITTLLATRLQIRAIKQQMETNILQIQQQINANKEQIQQQIVASKQQVKASQIWQLALAASQMQSEILHAYVPDQLKTADSILQLQIHWAKQSRQLILLGQKDTAVRMTNILNNYFDALRRYRDGAMPRGELEHRRLQAREEVTEILNNFVK